MKLALKAISKLEHIWARKAWLATEGKIKR